MDSSMNDISASFGAVLIGLLFSAFLFGLLSLQSYLYYRTCSNDLALIKIVIAVLWILNTSNLCFISYAQYRYLVSNFLLPQDDNVRTWSLLVPIAITSVITFIVQSFYVERIWFLSGKNVLLIVGITPLMVARLAIGITASVIVTKVGRYTEALRQTGWLTGCFASGLPSDVATTATLAYLFYGSRPLVPQGSLIDTLMLYILQTGLLPCVLSVVNFICYVTMENTLVFVGIHFVVGELYTSSMLVILNDPVSQRGRDIFTTSPHTALGSGTTSSVALGKSALRTDISGTDSTQSCQRHLSQITTDTFGCLEFRGNRAHSPSTPVYNASNVDSDPSGSGSGSAKKGPGTLAPLREESNPALSMCSDSLDSHSTDPNLSLDSVSTQSMERPGHDLGDIEWNGDTLLWQLGQSPRTVG